MVDGGVITWPVAFTIVSSLVVIVGAIVSMYGKKKTPDPDATKALHEVELVKTRVSNVESDIRTMTTLQQNNKESSDKESSNNREALVKMDQKLEKISDLMIELIRSRSD